MKSPSPFLRSSKDQRIFKWGNNRKIKPKRIFRDFLRKKIRTMKTERKSKFNLLKKSEIRFSTPQSARTTFRAFFSLIFLIFFFKTKSVQEVFFRIVYVFAHKKEMKNTRHNDFTFCAERESIFLMRRFVIRSLRKGSEMNK